jgi:hypothetical protein
VHHTALQQLLRHIGECLQIECYHLSPGKAFGFSATLCEADEVVQGMLGPRGHFLRPLADALPRRERIVFQWRDRMAGNNLVHNFLQQRGTVLVRRNTPGAGHVLRRQQLFPGIDNVQARECVRTIAGWRPLPRRVRPARLRADKV